MTFKNKRVCLTTDRLGVNRNGPGRFRIDAEIPVLQTCYFNVGRDVQTFIVFLSRHLNDEERNNNFCFKIDRVGRKTNNF